MLSVYACAVAIGGLSVLIGHGVCRLSGAAGWSWTAPAVGLAAALCVSEVAVRLPGHGWTVLVVLVALAAGGAVVLWPQVRRHLRGVVTGLLVAILVAAVVSPCSPASLSGGVIWPIVTAAMRRFACAASPGSLTMKG